MRRSATKRLLPLALAAALLLTGCGGHRNNTVSMAGLQENMLAAAPSLPEMVSVSDETENAPELFGYLSDLDYGKVEHFFLSYSAKGLADEIAVITVKNGSDVSAAEQSLQRHLADRTRLYEQYQPDQLQRVEGAQIFTRDQYAVLIVCDEADAVRDAFTQATAEG
ncbi:MAG: DUF4358 domain-containing protein [Ruminococcaceae bacterium]|jgi:hypothetical protein|nr:DUF4358 domain-containing protein [Oscillospiraceae bacterium]